MYEVVAPRAMPEFGRKGGELDNTGGAAPADAGTAGTAPAAPPADTRGAAAEFLSQAQATAPAAPAPAPVVPAAPAAAPAPAPGGVTPAAAAPDAPPAPAAPAPGPVPYDRFAQVVQARNEAQQQLEAFGPLGAAIQAAGISPEDAIARLFAAAPAAAPAAPAPAADPTAAYHSWLQAHGYNPFDESMTQQEYSVLRSQFGLQEQLQAQTRAFSEQQEAAQANAQRAQLEASMGAIVQASPILQDATHGPALQRAIYAQYWALQEAGQRGITLQQVAQQQLGAVQAIVQAATAQYATQKAADAAVPVVAGGGAPPPADPPNYGGMKQGDRRAAVASLVDATSGRV
jgi:hypothetical protein